MATKQIIDALLKQNREHDRKFGPGGNNHVPMMLIALYRMGADDDRIQRYAATFKDTSALKPLDNVATSAITAQNWREHLGQYDHFARYVDFFESWAKNTPVESILKETLPLLMKQSIGAAYHPLLRLGYAVDYGDNDEIIYSLAFFAAAAFAGPKFDASASAIEPDVQFSAIVTQAAAIPFEAKGNIQDRVRQIYAAPAFVKTLRPIKFTAAKPLETISALIADVFMQTQHFTILHALTSCQALRLLLPYLGDPQNWISEYWHSVCAAYLTVAKSTFKTGKDSAPAITLTWKDVLAQAAAYEKGTVSSQEHVIKLVYSCHLEAEAYKRSRYLDLAARELTRPAPFA